MFEAYFILYFFSRHYCLLNILEKRDRVFLEGRKALNGFQNRGKVDDMERGKINKPFRKVGNYG